MLLVTLFMYLLSAAFWSYSVVYAADKVQAQIDLTSKSSIPAHDNITQWSPLFNAVVMINVRLSFPLLSICIHYLTMISQFVLSDGVVVWRAWVISHRDLRKYLWVTMGFLVLTARMSVVYLAAQSFKVVNFSRRLRLDRVQDYCLHPGPD
jgi:hypothetical protein